MAQNKTETQQVPKKIFVSSTYEDMIPYRNKAMEALRQLQQTAIAMEDFEANNEPSIEVCRNKIEQSDIFLLIVGFKYGSILEEGKSFVELEYEQAIRLKKPILAFIVSDNAEVRVSLVDKGDPAERLDAFKKKLKSNHNVKMFETADSLYGYVLSSVKQEIQQISNNEKTQIVDGKEALNIFKKFLLMPNRYRDTEAILNLRVISGFSGWMLREDLVASLGLTIGDTIECDTETVDEETTEMLNDTLRTIDLFANNENAEWLVNNVTRIGTEIKAHVKFICKLVPNSMEPTKETIRAALILVKGIESTPPRGIYRSRK